MLPICALLHVHQTLLQVGTEVCEQCCSWLSCYTKITRKVQSSTFLFFVLYMCDMHNTFTVWTCNGGCNKISQTILDLGLYTASRVGMPGMSWENPMGHVGPGTLGPYTVSIGWTSRDAPGLPMGHLGSGTLEPYSASIGWTSQDFPGCPIGHLGPGTLGLYSAFTCSGDILGCLGIFHGTSWTWDSGTIHCLHVLDIPGCPRISHGTSWTWDSRTLQCLHSGDIPGCLEMSQDILDLHGTLGLYTISTAGTSWDVLSVL